MLDIKFIRDNRKLVENALKQKGEKVDINRLLDLDEQRKKKINEIQTLREKRHKLSDKSIDPSKRQKAKKTKEAIKDKEGDAFKLDQEYKNLLYAIPNIPLEDVPEGEEKNNKVLRKEGRIRKFDFKIKDHLEIGIALGIIDVERASKISGPRFAFLKNEGALLELALIQFVMSKVVREGLIPIIPPVLIKKEITDGLGYWHGWDNTVTSNENYYLVQDPTSKKEKNEMYLIGTGEHSIVAMFKDETLTEKELPKRYVAISSCFRREAGSYGKDTRGIFRVHQFEKIEMVTFSMPEDDKSERIKLLSIAEHILKELELPYQAVQLAQGDLGFPTAETIDLETWIPSQNKYRETHSISTTTNFQSRRLNIKFRKGNTSEFVHIVNGTALAIPRAIIAILENFQQKDGSVLIPKVLQQYTGFDAIKPKR